MEPPTKLEKYLSIETAGGADWHPNSEKVTYVSDVTGQYQIYRVTVGEGIPYFPIRLTSEADRCTDPRYLSDGSILFTRDRGGDENFQFGVLEDDSLTWLTSQHDVKHRVNFNSEDFLYYIANIQDRSRLDLYRWKISLRRNEPELILKPESDIMVAKLESGDKNSLILRKIRGNADQELILFDLEMSRMENLTAPLSEGKPTRWNAVRWLNQEKLLVITDHASNYNRLAILSLNSDFETYPAIEESLKWEVEDVTWNENSDRTYYVNNEEGYASLYGGIFKHDGIDEFETYELPYKGSLVYGDARSFGRGMTLSHDGKYLALTLSAPTKPVSVWIYDITNHSMWENAVINTMGLKLDDFRDCTLHRIESFDQLSIPYFRYIPAGDIPDGGWPGLMLIHGGPESQIVPSFSPVIQFYLSAGFAVITPNIRGSMGYGKTYLNLDNLEKRLDSIMDIKYIAHHLKKHDPQIDGNRLIIYGGSYGGFAVLSAMTEHPEIWKAGVDIVGISNFVTFLQNTASWRRPLRESEYGSLEHDMDTLIRISPIHKVDCIQAPLFIIQGDNDERVPLSESIQIYERVKEKGIEVQMLRYSDEGHGLAKLENRIDAYTKVLNWLNEIV